MDETMLAENRRAHFDYEIVDHYVAGIELVGHEVKSVRAKHASLQGSYAIVRGAEAWLINCQIPAYQQGNVPPEYDPSRTRRLLLHKDEIKTLQGVLKEKSFALLPLKFFMKEDIVPRDVDRGLYILAPIVAIVPALMTIAVIPSREVLLGQLVNLINSPIQRLAVVLSEVAKKKTI